MVMTDRISVLRIPIQVVGSLASEGIFFSQLMFIVFIDLEKDVANLAIF